MLWDKYKERPPKPSVPHNRKPLEPSDKFRERPPKHSELFKIKCRVLSTNCKVRLVVP